MKFFIAAIMGIGILIGTVGTASADYAIIDCDIMRIKAVDDELVYITFRKPNLQERTIPIDATYTDRGLAIALTAAALGMQVKANINWDDNEDPCLHLQLVAITE